MRLTKEHDKVIRAYDDLRKNAREEEKVFGRCSEEHLRAFFLIIDFEKENKKLLDDVRTEIFSKAGKPGEPVPNGGGRYYGW